MTVGQLVEALTVDELLGWQAFFKIENEEMDRANRKPGSVAIEED